MALTTETASRTSDAGQRHMQKATSKKLNDAHRRAVEEQATGRHQGGYMSEKTAEHTRKIETSSQAIATAEGIKSLRVTIESRINSSVRATQDLQNIARNFHHRITAAQQAGAEDRNFNLYCQNALKEVENVLNRRDEAGQPLFGGKKIGVDPVKVDDAAIPAPSALPNASYDDFFKGEKDSRHSVTMDNQTVDYGFNAFDVARDLIFYLKSGSATIPDGTEGSDSSIRLERMQDGLHGCVQTLVDTQEELGQDLGKVERIVDKSNQAGHDAQIQFNQIVSKDQWEAFIEEKEAAAQLEIAMRASLRTNQMITDMFKNS